MFPKLVANVACHDRLADFDFNIKDVSCREKLFALSCYSEAILAGE